MCDFALSAPNIEVVAGPVRLNTVAALREPLAVLREYWGVVREGDVVFVRANLPLVWTIHLMAALLRKPALHWMVGNPVAVLRGAARGYGDVAQLLGIAYAWIEQFLTKIAMRIDRASVLANGREVAALYPGPRTETVVSTSISSRDIRERADTCTAPALRILFVGFIRPEKGVEYLLRALPLLKTSRPWRLSIVGAWGQFEGEYRRLLALIDELGLAGRIDWEGYAEFGPALFAHMDRADLLVLPTLSEGTPRVLVEARARGLPLVSTNVGGIPSSVTNGEDGLLVRPRDPEALAAAMNRVLTDGELRRRLIRRGLERVRGLTVESFADQVATILAHES